MTTHHVQCRPIQGLNATLCWTRPILGDVVAGDLVKCNCGRILEADLLMMPKMDENFEDTDEYGPAIMFRVIRQPRRNRWPWKLFTR